MSSSLFSMNITTVELVHSGLRLLQDQDGSSRSKEDGPIAVLIVVCILFCIIWTPMLCQRRCRMRNQQAAQDQAAEIIRVSLRNLNLLGLDETSQEMLANAAGLGIAAGGGLQGDIGADGGGGDGVFGGGEQQGVTRGGLSPEDRRAFIKNVLVTRQIVQISLPSSDRSSTSDKVEVATTVASEDSSEMFPENPPLENNNNSDDDKTENVDEGKNDKKNDTTSPISSSPKNATLLCADIMDPETTTKHICVEPCPICLTEYKIDDLLCWSQNDNCQHVFHLECMEEWLLRNDQCPCCRTNYLRLNGDTDSNDGSIMDDINYNMMYNNNNTNNGGNGSTLMIDYSQYDIPQFLREQLFSSIDANNNDGTMMNTPDTTRGGAGRGPSSPSSPTVSLSEALASAHRQQQQRSYALSRGDGGFELEQEEERPTLSLTEALASARRQERSSRGIEHRLPLHRNTTTTNITATATTNNSNDRDANAIVRGIRQQQQRSSSASRLMTTGDGNGGGRNGEERPRSTISLREVLASTGQQEQQRRPRSSSRLTGVMGGGNSSGGGGGGGDREQQQRPTLSLTEALASARRQQRSSRGIEHRLPLQRNNTSNTTSTASNNNNNDRDANSVVRGMHLFYILSRLAETQGPNTTIRLEGLELADGRRGNVEIQGSGRGGSRATTTAAAATTTGTSATTSSSSSRNNRQRVGDIEMPSLNFRLGIDGARPAAISSSSSQHRRSGTNTSSSSRRNNGRGSSRGRRRQFRLRRSGSISSSSGGSDDDEDLDPDNLDIENLGLHNL